MNQTKSYLVGEHNPYQDGQSEEDRRKYALYPAPDWSAGARLCHVLGLGRADYLRRFERRDLLAALPWSVPAARKAARGILKGCGEGDRLILLGAKVAQAFSVNFDMNAPFAAQRVQVVGPLPHDCLVLPHPSGRSPAWNDPTMPARVRAAVAAFVPGWEEAP